VKVAVVRDAKAMQEFIRFPSELYAKDRLWVPQLRIDESKEYKADRNPVLAGSEHSFLTVRDGGKCVGRAIAYVDPRYNKFFDTRAGLFGAFECVRGNEASELLIGAIEEWHRARGMDQTLGPFNPVAESWGFLLKGDGKPPIFMTPHSKEYYLTQFERQGYCKAKDLLAYDANADGIYEIPRRIERFVMFLQKRKPELTVRPISRTSLLTDAEHIWRLSNLAIAGNWGYVPVEGEVMLDMVRRLKPVMDPDAIWFVEDGGVPVGFCLGFPDVNRAIKMIRGRLFPFGFAPLLTVKRWVKDYRLFGLAVHPDYQGMGLDVLLYAQLYAALKPRGIRLEANYVLEDNYRIRNALDKLGMRLIRSYRVFRKELS
jgi:ribosomal protein S18 acetylase RimI-like enzyme